MLLNMIPFEFIESRWMLNGPFIFIMDSNAYPTLAKNSNNLIGRTLVYQPPLESQGGVAFAAQSMILVVSSHRWLGLVTMGIPYVCALTLLCALHAPRWAFHVVAVFVRAQSRAQCPFEQLVTDARNLWISTFRCDLQFVRPKLFTAASTLKSMGDVRNAQWRRE